MTQISHTVNEIRTCCHTIFEITIVLLESLVYYGLNFTPTQFPIPFNILSAMTGFRNLQLTNQIRCNIIIYSDEGLVLQLFNLSFTFPNTTDKQYNPYHWTRLCHDKAVETRNTDNDTWYRVI